MTPDIWFVSFARPYGDPLTEAQVRALPLADKGVTFVEWVDNGCAMVTISEDDQAELALLGYIEIYFGDVAMCIELP